MNTMSAILIHDLAESIRLIRPVDLAQPTFMCLWLLILATPLRGIDRRDPFCGMMYVAFTSGAGVALIFALPQEYVSTNLGIPQQFLSVVAMMSVAAIRWWYKSDPRRRAKQAETQEAMGS